MIEQPRNNEESIDPLATEATRRFNENGPLGVTAEDHHAIGSTPPDTLESNPGKTLADLMTDTDIALWVAEQESGIKELLGPEFEDNAGAQRVVQQSRKHIEATAKYLASIGRPLAGIYR
jgi:hypothetical protein